ncbi:unnamed protein product [Euphydryas editha]|uniref:Uncharacterized protein n=1 Tax=Euphydryas editha TaxID=104508 RepID=A0AAU9UZA6_EUPED|nr:unnamed protein product [Euphydryas editha]
MVRVATGFGGKITSMETRLHCLFFLITIFGGSFLIVSITKISNVIYINSEYNILSSSHNEKSEKKESYTIKTEGCIIPSLQPFGEEIKQFVKYPKELKPCPRSKHALLGNNRTHIWIRNDTKKYYNIKNDTFLNCCYMSFYRPLSITNINSPNLDKRTKYRRCKMFSNIIEAKDEFVTVICNTRDSIVYHQYFLFTIKKDINYNGDSDKILYNKSGYNVIVMGIDAMSRLNFHRTMPKTLSFLQKKGAVELLGYNKVGDNTFPNLIPMLMGISEKELKNTCLPNKESTFDNCPFIWHWFKEIGYYTAFGEDSSTLGTFNYEKNGFIKSPTDYYIHTFINEAEKNAGVNKDMNSFLCLNEKYFYKVLLDYIENLTLTLKSHKLFGFFWEVTISHDDVNYPMVIDKDYVNFFKKLDTNNYLDDTIIFLVSDHGMRWGQIRSTNQGWLEERLPFVFILTPPEFRKKYNEAFINLNLNSHRLTTPYDLHATLIDLLELDTIEDRMIHLRKKQPNIESKGVSLFLPISTNRTCALAHIDDHWCSCHRGQQMSTNTEKSMAIAITLLQQINKILEGYSQCALLNLTELVHIKQIEFNTTEKIEWSEYMVVIKTTPGDGLFEGTLRHDGNKWSVVGTISRLNVYGDQSYCLHNYLLKLYCYCI